MYLKPPKGAMLNRGHNLSRGLVGCWLMNEGGGKTISNLVSANHGTFRTGIEAPSWGAGQYGPAVVFGTNDCIDVPILPLGVTNTISILAWIKPTADADNWDSIIYTNVDKVSLNYDDSSPHEIDYTWKNSYGHNTGLVPIIGEWNLIALTIKSTEANMYLFNSAGLNTYNRVAAHSANNFSDIWAISSIGTYSRYFYGSVSELYLFKRTLSPTEILSLYREPFQMFWVDA